MKITPREKGETPLGFSRVLISTRACVSLALLSLRKNGDYSQSSTVVRVTETPKPHHQKKVPPKSGIGLLYLAINFPRKRFFFSVWSLEKLNNKIYDMRDLYNQCVEDGTPFSETVCLDLMSCSLGGF